MKFKKNVQYELVEVPYEGIVGAGRLLPFNTPSGTTIVALPEGSKGIYGTLSVAGNSLEDLGIFEGDQLICKKAFSKREILPHTICIIYIPATGELVAKMVRFQGEYIILKSCNSSIIDIRTTNEDIDIRGIVVGFQRMLNIAGRLPNIQADSGDIPF